MRNVYDVYVSANRFNFRFMWHVANLTSSSQLDVGRDRLCQNRRVRHITFTNSHPYILYSARMPQIHEFRIALPFTVEVWYIQWTCLRFYCPGNTSFTDRIAPAYNRSMVVVSLLWWRRCVPDAGKLSSDDSCIDSHTDTITRRAYLHCNRCLAN